MSIARWWDQAENLRQRNGPGSFLWSYEVSNRGGAVIALLLRSTRVTPNTVTVAGLLVHVLGSVYVAQLSPPVTIAGVVPALIAWQVAYCLDGADGLLARERGQTSAFGAWLDQMADGVNHSSVFIGITLFLLRSLALPPTAAVVLLGVLLAGNLLLLFGWALRANIIGDIGDPAQRLEQHTSRLTLTTAVSLGLMQAIDYGVFLFVSSVLLLWPVALLVYVSVSGLLWVASVLGWVVRLWPRG